MWNLVLARHLEHLRDCLQNIRDLAEEVVETEDRALAARTGPALNGFDKTICGAALAC